MRDQKPMQEIALKIALIGFAGIAAQWIAWRLHFPAIALLFIAGLAAGPLTGFIDPVRDFGEIYRPVVSLCVAIILFEGGLTLNFAEIRETSKAVRRIILIGGPLVWLMGALAAHFAGGLSWPVAIILGAILVVTGPTVIMPLLRQARLKSRPASLLRWEAIVNDPIGALFAVLAFEGFLILSNVHDVGHLAWSVGLAIIIAVPGAWALSRFIIWLFLRGHVPEFLKAPVIVAFVLAAYAATNMVLEEAGLLTVTVMGITLANSRIASLAEMRRFKETITILLVSAVFILLTASLKTETVLSLGPQALAFVLALLFVVRPIAIFIATIGAGLTWQERLLTAWIAPRGIVAVAVSGLFGTTLVGMGVADGERMIAYTFAVVAATILLHGFSLPVLARLLDLRSSEKPGLLIVGSSPWSAALAAKLIEYKIPVQISDANWNHLRHARHANVPVFFGETLSEAAHHHLDLKTYQALIATTDNNAYNALVCTDFAPEIGRSRVFQLGDRDSENHRKELHFTIGGRPLMKPGFDLEELELKLATGWTFTSSRITEEFRWDAFLASRPEKTVPILWINPSSELRFVSTQANPQPSVGSHIISFGPKPEREQKPASSDQEKQTQ
ncbi:MAG: sodium:proton antiporter [Nitratireductor sp.]